MLFFIYITSCNNMILKNDSYIQLVLIPAKLKKYDLHIINFMSLNH